MTCYVWKVNNNFILLNSNNDGLFANDHIIMCLSLAHIFLCVMYPATCQAGCYLGGWRIGPCVSWCRKPFVYGFGYYGKTTDFCLTVLLLCLSSRGDSCKGKKTIKKKVGQICNVWLNQEVHLHFVTSVKPTQLLSRDFLSLERDSQGQQQKATVHQQRLFAKCRWSIWPDGIQRGQARGWRHSLHRERSLVLTRQQVWASTICRVMWDELMAWPGASFARWS